MSPRSARGLPPSPAFLAHPTHSAHLCLLLLGQHMARLCLGCQHDLFCRTRAPPGYRPTLALSFRGHGTQLSVEATGQAQRGSLQHNHRQSPSGAPGSVRENTHLPHSPAGRGGPDTISQGWIVLRSSPQKLLLDLVCHGLIICQVCVIAERVFNHQYPLILFVL